MTLGVDLRQQRPSPSRPLLWLNSRLVRRGGVLLTAAMAAYVFVEVESYRRAYPSEAARETLAAFGDNPAVRMLQGVPHDVDTVGGFLVWDAGWILEAAVAVWAMLATARLLRGEEEDGRAELLLAQPVRPGQACVVQLMTVLAVTLLVGFAVTVAAALSGAGAFGAVVFGVALAGLGATFAGVAAVAAQLFEVRRRAVGAATGAFVVLFVVRMVANSSDANAWLGWLTPFGWVDILRPFGDVQAQALAPLLLAPIGLAVVAVRLRGRRDEGAGLLASTDQRPARLYLLGGPGSFAWRSTQGVLLAWIGGLALYTFMIGSLLTTVMDFFAEDPNYRRMLEAMGLGVADTVRGLVGVMGAVIALVVSLYGAWRIGAARTEEATGRLELVLSSPVARWRWLGLHAVLTGVAATLLTLAAGTAMWLGAAVTGGELTLGDSLRASLNGLPAAAVFVGLAVLVLGTLPRLTVPLTASLAVVAYLVTILGPALDWPEAVLDLSPFHHLAFVPAQPYAGGPGIVMIVVGLVLVAAGLVGFQRRDLAGA